MEKPINADAWIADNRSAFSPPIGNKLMYKGDVSVMFVGGPNGRTDFHIDESAEFFYQKTGNMQLPIIEKGKRRLVNIRQGEVFLLPSRIPHSPQRPEHGSVGLVIERARKIIQNDDGEFDCLRWYTDFDVCDEIEFEAYFQCRDLGKDLLPAIQEYRDFKTTRNLFQRPETLPIAEDSETVVPAPFHLETFIEKNKLKLEQGMHVPLFKDHPETEFNIFLSSKQRELVTSILGEVFIYQVRGTAKFTGATGPPHTLNPSACFVLQPGAKWMAERPRDTDSVTLVMYKSSRV